MDDSSCSLDSTGHCGSREAGKFPDRMLFLFEYTFINLLKGPSLRDSNSETTTSNTPSRDCSSSLSSSSSSSGKIIYINLSNLLRSHVLFLGCCPGDGLRMQQFNAV